MAPFSQSAFAELDTHTKAQKVALVTAFALLAFRFIHVSHVKDVAYLRIRTGGTLASD